MEFEVLSQHDWMQAFRPALQQRFAETEAATQKLDWDALQDFVTSDDGKRELSALRTTYADVQSKAGAEEKVQGLIHSATKLGIGQFYKQLQTLLTQLNFVGTSIVASRLWGCEDLK